MVDRVAVFRGIVAERGDLGKATFIIVRVRKRVFLSEDHLRFRRSVFSEREVPGNQDRTRSRMPSMNSVFDTP
jgi:hypothetical protein